MAQGTRRWVRLAATGLGMLVCTGLVGCMGTSKDKEKNKIGAKQPAPTPGLPGAPTIPPGAMSRAPGANPYSTTGIQQTGGVAQQRVGTTGQNTLTTPGVPQPNFGGPSNYGTPATTISPPGQPGIMMPSVQPAPSGFSPTSSSSPLGAAPPGNWPGASTGTAPGAAPPASRVSSTPPAPQLNSLDPLPPPPPGSSTERASGGAYTPVTPVAPPALPVPPAVTPGPLG
ncbi:hypothetical protein R5W23_000668 [Gemmata sp. JC673]|uniref:Uncharacterized protein n=1 Tax=Gemmata algarum TaxID=2975278 RepID=A0ABU5EWH4_9BACT|nr:hypothetical protein [Gemmata algarum]MDY3559657.1 hypothetical protein [Gemmata algarum]